MRFMHGPNLTGFPACVFPVAYTAKNLPICIQFIGRAYQEVDIFPFAKTLGFPDFKSNWYTGTTT
jgi:Asp-tRNA(Asn)/Glu-tRNA(Gln) amidotransferase A subunit family amidase